MRELLADLFPEHNFKWKVKGQAGLGLCCFHNDKHHSLSIYKDGKAKLRFKCFSCGAGGSDLQAVMLSNAALTKSAANRWLTSHGYLAQTENDAKDFARNEVYIKFHTWTNSLLVNDPRAAGLRAYLAGRHISPSIVATAPIGYYPTTQEVEVWLATNEVPEPIAEEFIAQERSRFIGDNSIAFFYRSSYDQFSRIKLRNVLKEKPEDKDKSVIYLGGAKTKDKVGFFSATMDGLYTDHALVIEGEFDGLAIMSMCRTHDPDCVEPIYSFGSGGSMDSGFEILGNMGIDNTYTFPDNDGPGIDYAFTIAENHPHSFIVLPEDYKPNEDPADWAGRHTFDDLQLAYRQRIPAFAWIGKRMAEEVQSGSLEEQSHAKEKVITYAKRLTPTNREMFLKSYSPITGASYDSLCEEVQNNDHIRYRKVLTEDLFGIHMSAPGKKGETVWEHISNVIVEHDRDILLDDGTGETTRQLVIRVSMVNKEVTITVGAELYADDRKFNALLLDKIGSDLWVSPKKLMFLKESASILPKAGRAKLEEVIYTHLGWHDGMFLFPNGFIDGNGLHELDDIKVELPANPTMFTRYKTESPPEDMSYIREVIREDILKVFSYDVTLPMLAHIFLSPMMHFLPMVKPYCLWVQGLTGSFKTTYTGLMCSFFGQFATADFETWRSTMNSIQRNGHSLKDVPYVIDDFKRGDVSDKAVTGLIQSYADRHGRSRLKSDSTQQKTYFIRGNLISTAEDRPLGEASVIARTLMLPITRVGDCAKLTKGQLHSKHLMGVMAKFIQHLANTTFREDDLMARIRDKQAMFKSSHARVSENMAANSLAWDYVSEFLGLQDLTPQYNAAMFKMLSSMNNTTQEEKASTVYLDMIRELLSSGKFYLLGIRGSNSTDAAEHATMIGWMDTEHIYLLGGIALAEANALRSRLTGSTIKYSAQAIYDQLIDAGVLLTQNGKTTHVIKPSGGSSHRVLKLLRGVVEQNEEADYVTEPETSEVRIEENGALLN